LSPLLREFTKHVLFEAADHETLTDQIVELLGARVAIEVHTVRGLLGVAVALGILIEGGDEVRSHCLHNVIELNWFGEDGGA
jgi:hypothetical protein